MHIQSKRTPLHWSALSGRLELANLLIDRGSKVNAQDEVRKILLVKT